MLAGDSGPEERLAALDRRRDEDGPPPATAAVRGGNRCSTGTVPPRHLAR